MEWRFETTMSERMLTANFFAMELSHPLDRWLSGHVTVTSKTASTDKNASMVKDGIVCCEIRRAMLTIHDCLKAYNDICDNSCKFTISIRCQYCKRPRTKKAFNRPAFVASLAYTFLKRMHMCCHHMFEQQTWSRIKSNLNLEAA